MAIDLNRTTAGVLLPPSISSDVWTKAQEGSVFMQATTKVELPGGGVNIPMLSGHAEADWVDETDEKPVSRPTLANKTMSAYKLAVIVPFSNELKRDNSALYNTVVNSLPGALAKKFDETIEKGPAPGSNFDTLAGSPEQEVDPADAYASLIAAMAATTAAGGGVSAWLVPPSMEIALLGATAADGRPLFNPDAAGNGSVGRVLGRPVYVSKNITEGFAGDFTSDARYGTVTGITIRLSDQATINDGGTQINLWQRNMSAALCEVEVGFRVVDDGNFVKLTAPAVGP